MFSALILMVTDWPVPAGEGVVGVGGGVGAGAGAGDDVHAIRVPSMHDTAKIPMYLKNLERLLSIVLPLLYFCA